MAKLSRKYRYAYLLVKLYIQVYKKLRREFLRNSFKYIFQKKFKNFGTLKNSNKK